MVVHCALFAALMLLASHPGGPAPSRFKVSDAPASSNDSVEASLAPFPAEQSVVESTDFYDSLTSDSSISSDSGIATSYAPGEGWTVSMLNGTSSLRLFGNFSAIGVASTTRPFPAGTPLFLLPRPDSGNPTNTFDLHARQTMLGAAFSGPEVNGLTPGARFIAFLQNDNLTSDTYGLLPYNAYGELRSDTGRFAAGLQTDVFNPISPTVISLVKLYASGNTGSFRGQARLERMHQASDDLQVTTQFAISEPISTAVTDNRRLLEDNGWPNVELRVAAALGEPLELWGGRTQRALEFGVSGVIGQLRNAVLFVSPEVPEPLIRSTITVWGLGADIQGALTDRWGFAAEAYVGQGLGEYNGGIGQTFSGDDLEAIRSSGGFGEMYFYFSEWLHLHLGYGIDAPVRRDLAPLQIARNETWYANLVWAATDTLQVSFEVDYRQTDFVTLRDADGAVFLTEFLWRF